MKKSKFDFEACEHNEGHCDGTDCKVCEHGPKRLELFPNPPGMACTESLGEAVQGVIEHLEDLYLTSGEFKISLCVSRLENALERSNAGAS